MELFIITLLTDPRHADYLQRDLDAHPPEQVGQRDWLCLGLGFRLSFHPYSAESSGGLLMITYYKTEKDDLFGVDLYDDEYGIIMSIWFLDFESQNAYCVALDNATNTEEV